MFHTIAGTVADSIIPHRGSRLSESAWQIAYRGVDHAALRNACRNPELLRIVDPDIKRITKILPEMQAKRHLADYAPDYAFTKREVAADIDDCEAAISAFVAAPEVERRAFIVYILFKTR